MWWNSIFRDHTFIGRRIGDASGHILEDASKLKRDIYLTSELHPLPPDVDEHQRYQGKLHQQSQPIPSTLEWPQRMRCTLDEGRSRRFSMVSKHPLFRLDRRHESVQWVSLHVTSWIKLRQAVDDLDVGYIVETEASRPRFSIIVLGHLFRTRGYVERRRRKMP